MEKLRFFSRVHKAGLKINAKKCSFVSKHIPYLSHIITREGVKTDPKKIQVIMDLQCPKTTTDCIKIASMVQQYYNKWKCCSHVLAHIMESPAGKKGK